MAQTRLKKTLILFLSLALLLPAAVSALHVRVIADGHTRKSSDNPELDIVIEWDDEGSKDRPDEVTVPLTIDGETVFKEVALKESDSDGDNSDTWRKTIEFTTWTDISPNASENDDTECGNNENGNPDDEEIRQAIENITVLAELDVPGYDIETNADDGTITIRFTLKKKDSEENKDSNDSSGSDSDGKESSESGNGSTTNAGIGTTSEADNGSTADAGTASTDGTGKDATEDAGAASTDNAGKDSTDDAGGASTDDAGKNSNDDAGTAVTDESGKGATDDADAASTNDAGKDSTDDAGTASTADPDNGGKGNDSKTDSGDDSSEGQEGTGITDDAGSSGSNDGTASGDQGKSDEATGEDGTQTPAATGRLTVTVIWDDNDNTDAIRPASVTVRLLADGKETAVAKNTDNDGWKHIFSGLPISNGDKKISYTITQDAVNGYTTEIKGFTITNTHKAQKDEITSQAQQGSQTQQSQQNQQTTSTGSTSSAATTASDSASETISITVTKTWNDNNDSDHVRPESITVRLKANNTETASAKITKNDGWKYTFTNLAKTDKNGNAINYTVTEDAVSGYTVTYNGYAITNTHSTQKSSTSANSTGKTSDGSNVKTDSSVRTGDTTRIAIYFFLLAIAVGGCAGCAVYLHKKKKTSPRKPAGK